MRTNKAFSLVELLLVIIIISVLSAIVATNLTGRTNEAKISAAKAEIENSMATALELYELDNGQYPTTDQGLKALVDKPVSPPVPDNWKGPYLKMKSGSVPMDPWNQEYQYESPGKNRSDFDIFSAGPDKIAGNEDDITNWDSN